MEKKAETYSISQVSQMTGVSKNRIREWHGKGYLSEVRWISVGNRRHRRFSERDLSMIRRIDEYLRHGFALWASALKSREDMRDE
jgi:DNA-binding transcriptional MerR regulator